MVAASELLNLNACATCPEQCTFGPKKRTLPELARYVNESRIAMTIFVSNDCPARIRLPRGSDNKRRD